MARAAHHDVHEVAVQGVWNSDALKPTLVERTEEDFLEAMLSDLRGTDPQSAVIGHRPGSSRLGLRLYQPVHRVFNLVLVEAFCEAFMRPRLDPRRIDSAGFVIRRVISETVMERRKTRGTEKEKGRSLTKVYQAWCTEKGRGVGWRDLDSASAQRDPDPARRSALRFTGDRLMDAELFGPQDRLTEQVTSLFVAPDDVSSATGKTLLYGVIPTSSTSRAGAAPKGPEPNVADWEDHLSLLLKQSEADRGLWPDTSASRRAETLNRSDLRELPTATHQARFILLVRQLAQEFNLLRPVNPNTHAQLIDALNRLTIRLVNGSSRAAGDYLVDAARFYFEEVQRESASLSRPKTWPTVSADVARTISGLLRQIANETELSVFASEKFGGRFDDSTALHVVQAFVRVKQHPGCPPRIIWSQPSDEFMIVPWFESGPVPPVQVALPDPFDKGFLNAARPGVAFGVPRKLANALNQDPKKLMDGTPGSSNFALDWICGFNIPIITICAFVVLNIFLGLLNIIFWWLPFVKICIPFPRKK